jgi:hypothetical protein
MKITTEEYCKMLKDSMIECEGIDVILITKKSTEYRISI